MMEDAFASRVAANAGGLRGGGQRWPRLDAVAVVSDFQKGLAGVKNWLGFCVQEGATRLGQSVEEGKGGIAQRMERIGKKGRGARNEGVNGQFAQLWMTLLGFGARFEEHLQRTRSEAMLRMVRYQEAPRPLMAAMSLGLPTQLEAKHVFDIAMSGEQVAKRLDGVPVYTVSNSANEFVLVSDLNTSKSLGIFCFREADAEALLSQVSAVHEIIVSIASCYDVFLDVQVVRVQL